MNSREVLLFVTFSPFYESYRSSDGKKDPAYTRTRTGQRQVAARPQECEHQDQKKPFLVVPHCSKYHLEQQQAAEVGDVAEVPRTHFGHHQHHQGYSWNYQQSENARSKLHVTPPQAKFTASIKPAAQLSGVYD